MQLWASVCRKTALPGEAMDSNKCPIVFPARARPSLQQPLSDGDPSRSPFFLDCLPAQCSALLHYPGEQSPFWHLETFQTWHVIPSSFKPSMQMKPREGGVLIKCRFCLWFSGACVFPQIQHLTDPQMKPKLLVQGPHSERRISRMPRVPVHSAIWFLLQY